MANATDPTEPLPSMPPAIATLEAQLEKRAKTRGERLVGGEGFAVFIAFLFYDAIHGRLFLSTLIGLGGLTWGLFCLQKRKYEQSRLNRSLKVLTKWEDPRAVGLLCRAYCCQDNGEREAHRSRLLQSLPLLTEKDAEYFTFNGRNGLYSLLLKDDRDLKIAALKGLAQVCNKDALGLVKAFAMMNRDASLEAEMQICIKAIITRLGA